MMDALGAVARRTTTLTVTPSRLAWFRNDEGTRAFLVLAVADGSGGLERLLEASNAVAERFGCRKLYAGKKEGDNAGAFHISLAWSLEVDERLLDGNGLEKHERSAVLVERAKGLQIDFSEVKLRLGNEVSSIPFGRSKQQNRGIFG